MEQWQLSVKAEWGELASALKLELTVHLETVAAGRSCVGGLTNTFRFTRPSSALQIPLGPLLGQGLELFTRKKPVFQNAEIRSCPGWSHLDPCLMWA